jgi:hypothetical protein
MEERGGAPLGRYSWDLRKIVDSSASTCDYTLTVWSAGIVLSLAYGPPSPPEVFSLFLGTTLQSPAR